MHSDVCEVVNRPTVANLTIYDAVHFYLRDGFWPYVKLVKIMQHYIAHITITL